MGSNIAPNGCCCCCYTKKCRVSPEQNEENMLRIENCKTQSEKEAAMAEISNGSLGSGMRKYGELITSKVGSSIVLLLFLGLCAFGSVGVSKIYKDFKLEWFVPDNSYVNVFYKYNDEMFASGSPCTVYVEGKNMFKVQQEIHELGEYLNTSKYFDKDAGYTDWYEKFQESATGENTTLMGVMDTSNPNAPIYQNETAFFKYLHEWMMSAAGGRYRRNVHWNDVSCDNVTEVEKCDPSKGIKEARWQATLSLEETSTGQKRYDTMTAVRKKVSD